MATNTPEHYPFCTIVNRKGRLYSRGNVAKKEHTYIEKVDTGKVDESGNPIYEEVEITREEIVGEVWLAKENIKFIPFIEAQYSFLTSLKSSIEGLGNNPIVVRYNVRNPSEHSEASEVKKSDLLRTINSMIDELKFHQKPTEYYPSACVLKYDGKFVDLGEEHLFIQPAGLVFLYNGEFWIWSYPSRNERFIYPAKKLLENIYKLVNLRIEDVGYDDWEDLRFKVVYYSPHTLKETSSEICDPRRMWDICTNKIKQLSRELKYIYNKEGWKKDLGDKMAGGSLYHPLNAFWETSPKKGIYKSYELQKELYNQKLAGQPKYQPFGAIDF